MSREKNARKPRRRGHGYKELTYLMKDTPTLPHE
jgi:hypothetical protein